MPHRMVWVQHTAVLGLLFLSALAMQGCLAVVWLGAVGIDTTRTSDIEFQSFENSWVVASHERQHLASVKSIAVMPFVGDPVMAERWTAVFRKTTDLRVVSLSNETRYEISDHGQIGLAQRIGAELHVDCVLFGNVAGQEPQKSFVGLKESSSRRLYLQMVSTEGTLIWKTELPFTMVKGTKGMDEEFVIQALLTHVRTQANELGLADLGTTTMQAAPRSLRDTSDNQIARPVPRFERP
ncbi:MAG TPA: hypothetical protein VK598_06485 [Nitrospiraceae bacterium]|nr:hypothetical protein [Nitrospiraceae bacterium]